MTRRALLVMAEHVVGDSPLWLRQPAEGQADAVDLGLSEGLRAALEAWNGRWELTALEGAPGTAEGREHAVTAFELAARVQEELGDAWAVWCGGGGGVDALRDRGSATYDRATGAGSVLLSARDPWLTGWSSEQERRAPRQAFSDELLRSVRAWARSADRVGGTAHRVAGLRLAARVAAEAEPRTRVLWFGGADVPG